MRVLCRSFEKCVYNASGKKQIFFIFSIFFNLTRNSSTLRPLELDVQSTFYRFSSVNERNHKPDRSMLLLYPASAVMHQQCRQFVFLIHELVKSTKLAF